MMNWETLLCDTRVRPLLEGGDKPLPLEVTNPKGAPLPPDARSQFQRDYDRLAYSSAVRRLQDKTQVFPLDPSDAVRTRLTHSLEVSSLARGLAQAITDALKIQPSHKPHIVTISQTVGLIHDLGNPSFGHAGEKAIQEWFSRRKQDKGENAVFAHLEAHMAGSMVQDFLQFEGNAQTIRLLSHLQLLADDYGMNVTAATLCAALKYTAPSSETTDQDHRLSKPGFHIAELDVVNAVREATGVPRKSRHPIAFIAEAADDCVYSMVDFEDAIRKQVLSWREAVDLLPKMAKAECGAEAKPFMKELLKGSQKYIDWKLKEESGVTLRETSLEDAYAQSFRNRAALFVVDGCKRAFLDNYTAIMNGSLSKELSELNTQARFVIHSLKRLGREYIYATRPNLELELRGRQIIQSLMDVLWEGIAAYDVTKRQAAKPKKFSGKAWELISGNYRSVFERSLARSEETAKKLKVPVLAYRQYLKLLLLTDYVSGMTDSYASRLYKALFHAE